MYKMKSLIDFKDQFIFEVPGKSSFESVKRNIRNYFEKGKYYGANNFMMNVSCGYESPGFLTYVKTRKELNKKFEFIEERHLKEDRAFWISIKNVYLVESKENLNKFELKENVRDLAKELV
jgi:hypothetical protein